MPAKVFLTGFPGFLGSELVRRILARPGRPDVVCLVQPKFAALAARRAEEIAATEKVDAARIQLVEGDITRQNLDLDDVAATAQGVTEIFHLAAVYDLSVPREVGLKVNVTGTRNVLAFAERCAALERHQYVSTCYVSGRYAGIFRETDLEKGQQFNNFYEETKYLAELDVRRKMEEGMPTTIYRPAVVVGDSKTGETQKYDGPYYVIRWLLKQPTLAFLPVPGHPDRTRINLVPRDFVVAAIDALSQAKHSAGRCYQLADPEPPTIAEVIKLMADATGRAIVQLPAPLGLAKLAIDKVPGVYKLMEIPASSVDYFVHPTFYDTTNATRDLAKAGIVCPRFGDYLPNLVAFFKAHPEIASDAMV